MDAFLNQSDQTFVFLSGTHMLDTNIVVRTSTNLTMIGDDMQIESSLGFNIPSSNIQCKARVGFAFFVVQSLSIANLSFTECGTDISELLPSLSQLFGNVLFANASVSLGFAFVKNVNVSGVLVQNSTGFGIAGVNMGGSTKITNSAFVYNHGDESKKGGNAVFLFIDIPSLCSASSVDFTISSSHILHGSSPPTTALPTGLQIFILQECSHLNINIRNTSISHNINPPGGFVPGANLAIDVIQQVNSSGSHHIIIENCHIEGGKGYSSAGVSLVALSQQKPTLPEDCPISTTSEANVLEIISTQIVGNYATHLTGGGLGILLNLCHSYNIIITNVTLRGNVIQTHRDLDDEQFVPAGGNAFITIIPALPGHSVKIKDSIFKSGEAVVAGGLGIAARPPLCTVGLDRDSTVVVPQELVSISNTSFSNNTAISGGAIGMLDITQKFPVPNSKCKANFFIIQISECNFTNNFGIVGSALAAQTQDTYNTYDLLKSGYFSFVLSKCIFSNNHNLESDHGLFPELYFKIENVNRAAVFLQRIHNISLMNCKFIENNSTALLVEKSNVVLGGDNVFAYNTATRGGGISLLYSYLFPELYTELFFTGNHAHEVGGGIYIREELSPNDIHPCFLQLNVPHSMWPNETGIQIHFENNSAEIAGTSIYGGYIDMCRSQPYNDLHFQVFPTHSQSIEKTLKFINQPGFSVISSDPLGICFCDNRKGMNCSLKLTMLKTYPGADFNISLVTVGQQNGTVPGVVRAEFSKVFGLHSLGPSQGSQSVPHDCANMSYTVFSNRPVEYLKLSVENPAAFYAYLFKPPIILVELMQCPFGFTLEGDQMPKCECVQVLRTNGFTCDINTLTIHRPPGVWLGHSNHINNSQSQSANTSAGSKVVLHRHCPFRYCKPGNIDLKVETFVNGQCAFNRDGILCGGCLSGFSAVLGTSRCKKCANWSIVFLLVFAVAGLLLVVFLAICNLTVAEGTISGLIFYTNVIQASQSTFIGYPCETSATIMNTAYSKVLCAFSIVIAWINLDVGIETCLYNGMDMYAKAWLQFLFPVYIWIVVTLMIIVSHYSIIGSRILGRNSHKVLATLFLLSYAKILDAVITIFSFTFLDYPDSRDVVWLYDGNISYFRGKHIPLFIAAIIFTIAFLIPFTVIVLFIQCLQKRSWYRPLCWVRKLKPLFDAYTGPYKDKYRFWTGLLLLARLILFLIYASSSLGSTTFNVLLTGITAMLLLMLESVFRGIYKHWSLNVLETSFLLNLALLCIATLYVEANDGNQSVVALTSTGVACVTFVGILTYQIIVRLKQLKCTCMTHCRKDPLYQPMASTVAFSVPKEEPPPDVEPLRLTFDESEDEFVLVHAEN